MNNPLSVEGARDGPCSTKQDVIAIGKASHTGAENHAWLATVFGYLEMRTLVESGHESLRLEVILSSCGERVVNNR